MQLTRLIQIILFVVIWVLVILSIVIFSIISVAAGWSMPAWLSLILIGIGVILTAIVASTDRFNYISRQIENQLSGLSDEEMQEVLDAMDEVKENIGLSVELPVKHTNKKRKQGKIDIDRAIRNLSDTELLHLKEQLRNGSMDDEKLIAWLDSQRERSE